MARRIPRSFGCPAEFTLVILGGKWKSAILCYLRMQPMRYSELRRVLPQLSDKVLSERLRELEGAGLVVRDVEGAAPAITLYRLSPRGESLRPVLSLVDKWALEHANAYGVRWEIPLMSPGRVPTGKGK